MCFTAQDDGQEIILPEEFTHHFGRMLGINVRWEISLRNIFLWDVLEFRTFCGDYIRENMDPVKFNSPGAYFITSHLSQYICNFPCEFRHV